MPEAGRRCAEHRPELVAHAGGHAVAHILARPPREAGQERNEMVDNQRTSRCWCVSTDCSSSLGDLASRGNGVEVDAEHELSPHPPESVDGAGHEYPVGRDCHPERPALEGSNVICPRQFNLRDRKDEISSAEDDLQP